MNKPKAARSHKVFQFVDCVSRVVTIFGPRMLLFGLLSISTLPVFAQGISSESCTQIRQDARVLFRNMNSLFRVTQTMEFVTETNDGSPLDLAWAGNPQGGPIHMPDPCHLTDREKVSKDLYLFVLAHEFSHGIIDQPMGSDCIGDYWSQFDDDYWESDTARIMREQQHVNTDMLALKTMAHFNLDQSKAVSDFQRWILDNESQRGINASNSPFQLRAAHIHRHIPTDFSHGHDFTSGYVLQNVSFMESFLAREYPGSTLVSDLRGRYDSQRNDCLFSSGQQRAEGLLQFQSQFAERSSQRGSVNSAN
jgi:hypothetical protein